MMRKKYFIGFLVVFGAVLFLSATAIADDYYCDGTVEDGHFDNVIVPWYAECVLTGTKVKGNVNVFITRVIKLYELIVHVTDIAVWIPVSGNVWQHLVDHYISRSNADAQ